MKGLLLVLNLLAALASSGWAVVALVRPGLLSGSTQAGTAERFYARMYAARAIPVGLAAGFSPFSRDGDLAAWIVLGAALVQAADAVIATLNKDRKMLLGSCAGALIHGVCAVSML